MNRFLVGYVLTLVMFGLIDIAWIAAVAAPMFRDALADSLASGIRVAPALLFYAIFPVGIMYFAVLPSIKAASTSLAAVNGALFGFFTYATYDLTNFATLKGWTLEITVVDIFYGAIVVSIVSTTVSILSRRILGQTGRNR